MNELNAKIESLEIEILGLRNDYQYAASREHVDCLDEQINKISTELDKLKALKYREEEKEEERMVANMTPDEQADYYENLALQEAEWRACFRFSF